MGSSDSPPSSNLRPSGLRRVARPVVVVAILAFAVHILLPQVGELGQGIQNLRSGRWPFLGLSLVGSALAYVSTAWTVRVSVDRPPPWRRTIEVQVAASAAALLTPLGVGWVAINEGFLRTEGNDTPTARAATALNMVLTFVSHIGLLVLVLPLLPILQLPTVSPPQRRIFVDIAVAAAVVAGLVFWIPYSRRRVVSSVRPTLEALPHVIRNRRRSLLLVIGAAATNLAYSLALYGAITAFGDAPTPFAVLVAYLLAATVAAIAPTPGGLGAMETALVAALTRLGVPGGQAVAATLAFRIATFWLPIGIGALELRRAKSRRWI